MKTTTISKLFREAAKILRSDFEYIRASNPHSAEKGAEVENVLKAFLNRHRPGFLCVIRYCTVCKVLPIIAKTDASKAMPENRVIHLFSGS